MSGQKRLQKELMKLQKNPEVDTTITIIDENIFKWEVSILGPKVLILFFSKFYKRKHHMKEVISNIVLIFQKNIQ